MNTIDLLTQQTQDAYTWTNRLIDSIPQKHWEEIPDVLSTSVSWQVGHLILSFYYHSITCITGHQPDVLAKIPLREYAGLYIKTPAKQSAGRVNPEVLHEQLLFVEEKSIASIQSLSADQLQLPLEPTTVPHPIAKNKFEAIDWNIKHTMWHCGQIGILSRVVHQAFDFGLQLPKRKDAS